MDTPVIRRSRIVVLALGMGVFFTAQPLLMNIAGGRHVSFQFDVLQEASYWLVWALLSPLIMAAARRWPLDAQGGRHSIAAHVVISVTLAPLQAVIAFTMHLGELVLLGAVPLSDVGHLLLQRRVLVLWGFFTGAYFYWVIVAIYTALRFRGLYAAEQVSVAALDARSASLERELVQSRLDALRSQLHPHFLFNTLNSIAVLAQEDVEKARQMLFRLGSLLRRSLEETQHEVPLSQEALFLEEYLDIQRVRFGERLMVRVEIDSAVADQCVPVLLLQPLIENAIEHGASTREATHRIVVTARRIDDVVSITVDDNGPGPGSDPREGVGLSNSRERLRRLYGESAALTLTRRSIGGSPGASVEVRIPIQPGPVCGS